MTAQSLHNCDKCHEQSEVWGRTATGAHFSYCINKSCPSNRKIVLDKTEPSSIIKNTTPETDTPEKITPGFEGTTQMTYRDAKILIDEGRNLGYRGTDWEQSFLQRLEAMQPVFLLPEDAKAVEEFYRRATGGGFRTRKRSLMKTPDTDGYGEG